MFRLFCVCLLLFPLSASCSLTFFPCSFLHVRFCFPLSPALWLLRHFLSKQTISTFHNSYVTKVTKVRKCFDSSRCQKNNKNTRTYTISPRSNFIPELDNQLACYSALDIVYLLCACIHSLISACKTLSVKQFAGHTKTWQSKSLDALLRVVSDQEIETLDFTSLKFFQSFFFQWRKLNGVVKSSCG